MSYHRSTKDKIAEGQENRRRKQNKITEGEKKITELNHDIALERGNLIEGAVTENNLKQVADKIQHKKFIKKYGVEATSFLEINIETPDKIKDFLKTNNLLVGQDIDGLISSTKKIIDLSSLESDDEGNLKSSDSRDEGYLEDQLENMLENNLRKWYMSFQATGDIYEEYIAGNKAFEVLLNGDDDEEGEEEGEEEDDEEEDDDEKEDDESNKQLVEKYKEKHTRFINQYIKLHNALATHYQREHIKKEKRTLPKPGVIPEVEQEKKKKLDEEINEREMRDIRKKEKLLDLAEKERQQKLVKDESDKALIETPSMSLKLVPATPLEVLNTTVEVGRIVNYFNGFKGVSLESIFEISKNYNIDQQKILDKKLAELKTMLRSGIEYTDKEIKKNLVKNGNDVYAAIKELEIGQEKMLKKNADKRQAKKHRLMNELSETEQKLKNANDRGDNASQDKLGTEIQRIKAGLAGIEKKDKEETRSIAFKDDVTKWAKRTFKDSKALKTHFEVHFNDKQFEDYMYQEGNQEGNLSNNEKRLRELIELELERREAVEEEKAKEAEKPTDEAKEEETAKQLAKEKEEAKEAEKLTGEATELAEKAETSAKKAEELAEKAKKDADEAEKLAEKAKKNADEAEKAKDEEKAKKLAGEATEAEKAEKAKKEAEEKAKKDAEEAKSVAEEAKSVAEEAKSVAGEAISSAEKAEKLTGEVTEEEAKQLAEKAKASAEKAEKAKKDADEAISSAEKAKELAGEAISSAEKKGGSRISGKKTRNNGRIYLKKTRRKRV